MSYQEYKCNSICNKAPIERNLLFCCWCYISSSYWAPVRLREDLEDWERTVRGLKGLREDWKDRERTERTERTERWLSDDWGRTKRGLREDREGTERGLRGDWERTERGLREDWKDWHSSCLCLDKQWDGLWITNRHKGRGEESYHHLSNRKNAFFLRTPTSSFTLLSPHEILFISCWINEPLWTNWKEIKKLIVYWETSPSLHILRKRKKRKTIFLF